jgi:hypothetical protein
MGTTYVATVKLGYQLHGRVAHLARRVSIRLRFFQRGLDLTLRQIPAPVFVVLLSSFRDVDGRGLGIFGKLYDGLLRDDVLDRRDEKNRAEKNQ